MPFTSFQVKLTILSSVISIILLLLDMISSIHTSFVPSCSVPMVVWWCLCNSYYLEKYLPVISSLADATSSVSMAMLKILMLVLVHWCSTVFLKVRYTNSSVSIPRRCDGIILLYCKQIWCQVVLNIAYFLLTLPLDIVVQVRARKVCHEFSVAVKFSFRRWDT